MAPLRSIEAIDPEPVNFKPRGIRESRPDEITNKVLGILLTGKAAKLTYSGSSRNAEAYYKSGDLRRRLKNQGLKIQTQTEYTETEYEETVLTIGLKKE